jgi:hypothetical protein
VALRCRVRRQWRRRRRGEMQRLLGQPAVTTMGQDGQGNIDVDN